MRGRRAVGVIVLGWLLIAGPLNYLGVNPKVKDCFLPQPSSMSFTTAGPLMQRNSP